MELAIPHIVVRTFHPGIGIDLISALTVHPVEVSEARDSKELHRKALGRPAILVIIVDPPDLRAAAIESRDDFPGVPILVISDKSAPQPGMSRATTAQGRVEVIPSSQALQSICWQVMEAVSRASLLSTVVERPLGPVVIETDERGVVLSDPDVLAGTLIDGRFIRPGEPFLSIVDPRDRGLIAGIFARARPTEAEFCVVRLVSEFGVAHSISVGIRSVAPGRIALLVQPLISGGPIVGLHINNHDPITGLLTRWAMSRELEARERLEGCQSGAMLLLRLEELSAISDVIGHKQTDIVLVRTASALNEIFPYPALGSRLMGDAFLVFVPNTEIDECCQRGQRLIQAVNAIDVPGFGAGFKLRASVGTAVVEGKEHDLAYRLAEAAAAESQAAGSNRVVVAGAAHFTRAQTAELTACMDRGSWEVWLQPVMGAGGGRPDFHEALARFDVGPRRMASRADFFMAGRAAGLLERFDRMMLQRTLEILESHPQMKISVNVTFETFTSGAFPAEFLKLIREFPRVAERIILEIAPRCMAAPAEMVSQRLRGLATAGVAVALDDFGSGICRLQYLTQLPIAMVKLDELVTGYVDDDPLQRDFVRTVVSICRARGITTVAEYTRSEAQLTRLVDDGVNLFQGELFGMPRPAADVLAALMPGAAQA